MQRFYCVVTTIQPPTGAMNLLASCLTIEGGSLVVVGDKKGPAEYDVDTASFLSLDDQYELGFELATVLPTGHYCRKNLGYLYAMAQGADLVYETDDDNAPLMDWRIRTLSAEACRGIGRPWLNVYRHFSEENIWPRGFPLDEIVGEGTVLETTPLAAEEEFVSPIQQGLANNSPDVDAIWRLVLGQPVEFHERPSIWVPPGTWCPFNSQSTWWWPDAYPLMYLPSYCSFRMTDIWRSFVAQRCLWEMGYGLVFHGAEVIQDRNEHRLLTDFADEIPGYLRNKELVSVLASLELSRGALASGENLLKCYEALVEQDFFPEKELVLVKAWLEDLSAFK